MSHRESNVDKISGYIDTQYSSGDSHSVKSKQQYQEENNNDIDELSKDLSEMGCIVDSVKRPPNICVETCVYEGSDSSDEEKTKTYENQNEEDVYSDEFEEDKSEIEEESIKAETKSVKSVSTTRVETNQSKVQVSKSQSSMSSKLSTSSGKPSGYGSISIPQTRRINMSFTNERLREIERHNHILLNKILSARNVRKSSIPPREQSAKKPLTSAAVYRRKQQRQIDHDNLVLLKKIQHAKASACSIRR